MDSRRTGSSRELTPVAVCISGAAPSGAAALGPISTGDDDAFARASARAQHRLGRDAGRDGVRRVGAATQPGPIVAPRSFVAREDGPRRRHRRAASPAAAAVAGVVAVAAALVMAAHMGSVSASDNKVDNVCPENCNGHGTCGTSSECTCTSQWTGPSCGGRTCPTGVAWVDKVIANDDAHNELECSNAGICDRSSGMCDCFGGFTGQACERTVCKDGCHRQGRCVDIARIGLEEGTDTSTPGDGVGQTYANWDSGSTMGCVCDDGLTGPDCSLRMCPKGDDPRTRNSQDRVIQMVIDNSNSGEALAGNINIRLGMSVASGFPALGSTASIESLIQTSFESLANVESARVVQTALDGTADKGATYIISLVLDTHGQNNFHEHGDVTASDFECDLTKVSAAIAGTPSCTITDPTMAMVPTGTHTTSTSVKVIVSDQTGTANKFQYSQDNAAWTEATMSGVAQQIGATNMYVTFATIAGHTKYATWEFNGDTTGVTLTASPTTREHEYCGRRGLCNFYSGNCTCNVGISGQHCEILRFLNVSDDTNPIWGVRHLNATKSDYAGSVLAITNEDNLALADTWSQIRGIANDVTVFRLTGAGLLSAASVTFSSALTTNTLEADNGETITTGGLKIDAGGATASGGPLYVVAGGGTIVSQQATITAGNLESTDAAFDNTALRLNVNRASGDNYNLVDMLANSVSKFTVRDNGKTTVAGGMDVSTGASVVGGARLLTGDAAVSSGGTRTTQSVQGAPSLVHTSSHASFDGNVISGTSTRAASSAFKFINAFANSATPAEKFYVRGDGYTYIDDNGLDVLAGGMTVEAGGFLTKAGSVTVLTSGLRVNAGGMTVTGGGLKVYDDSFDVTSTSLSDTVATVEATGTLNGGRSVLEVDVTTAGSTQNHDPFIVRRGASTVFQVRGDGETAFHANTVIGDSSSDLLTVTSALVGLSPLVFEGHDPTAGVTDGNQLTLALDEPTADRTITIVEKTALRTFPVTHVTNVQFTNGRIPEHGVGTSGQLATPDTDLSYDGGTLNINGGSAATFRSSTGGVTLTGGTTLTMTASNGDATVASTTDEVLLTASHATDGNILLTTGNVMTMTSGSTLTAVTAGAAATSAIVLGTGIASNGAAGSVTLSTGDASKTSAGADSGAITLSTGATNNGVGAIVITAGQTTEATARVGGGVAFTGGESAVPGDIGTSGTGGTVTMTAGGSSAPATPQGGDLIARPGTATNGGGTGGSVILKSGDATARMTIGPDDELTLLSATANELSTSSGAMVVSATAGALTTSASGAVTMSAGTTVTMSSDGDFALQGEDVTSAGDITLRVGTTTHATSSGSNVVVTGGKQEVNSKTGGFVNIIAGEASGTTATGGGVTITGGQGTHSGGSVTVTPGATGTNGLVDIVDGGTTTRIRITAAGAIQVPPSGTVPTATVRSVGALTASSSAGNAQLSASGAFEIRSISAGTDIHSQGALTLSTDDVGAATPAAISISASSTSTLSNSGGSITLSGSDTATSTSQTAGSINIDAGTGGHASATAGSVNIEAGDGPSSGGDGTIKLKDYGSNTALSVLADGSLDVDARANVDIATKDVAGGSGTVNFGSGTASAGATGAVTISTGAATGGSAGSITLTVGQTTTTVGSALTVKAGKTTASATGGAVTFAGGEGATTGGAMTLSAGDGNTGAGGGLVLTAGTGGTTNGVFNINDGGSVTRMKVGADGSFTLDGVTSSTVATGTVKSYGALTLSSSNTDVSMAGTSVGWTATASTMTLESKTGMTLKTTDTTSTPGAISISAGKATGDDGAAVTLSAGTTSGNGQIGGALTITGGQGSHRTEFNVNTAYGGDVSMTGGDAAAAGSNAGSVTVTAGVGTGAANEGEVKFKDGAGTQRLNIDTSGNLDTDGASSTWRAVTGTATFSAATGGVTMTAQTGITITATTTTGTVTAETDLTLKTDDITGSGAGSAIVKAGASSAQGGAHVTVTGGKTTTAATKTAGDVTITGGQATGATSTGGSVSLVAGAGTGTNGKVNLKDYSGNTGLSVLADGSLDVDALANVDIATKDTAGGTGYVRFGSGTASSGASGAVTISSGAATGGSAGSITMTVGRTTTTTGSDLTFTAGKTTATGGAAGGAVTFAGGEGATTGGAMTLSAGDGTTGAGGGLVLTAGTGGTTNGVFNINDGGSVTRMNVGADGSFTLDGVTSSTVATGTVQSYGALTMSSSNGGVVMSGGTSVDWTATGSTMTLDAGGGMTLKTSDVAATVGTISLSASSCTNDNAGSVTITGGATNTASGKTAGSVSVVGGSASGATSNGGGVVLQSGAGNPTDGNVILKRSTVGVLTVQGDGDLVGDMASIDCGTGDGTTSGTSILQSGTATGGAGASGTVKVVSGQATSGAAGAVTVSAGRSDNSVGTVSVVGGKTTANPGTGGAVSVTGGVGTTGGSVTIAGGVGTQGSGDAILVAGDGGTTDGLVRLTRADGTTNRVAVSASGAVTLSSTVLTITDTGAFTFSAATTGTFTSATSKTTIASTGDETVLASYATGSKTNIITSDRTGGAAGAQAGAVTMSVGSSNMTPLPFTVDGGGCGTGKTAGAVTITGGAASHATSSTGGAVTINGGDGSGLNAGGDAAIQPGSGSSQGGTTKLNAGDAVTVVTVGNDGSLTLSTDAGYTDTTTSAITLTGATTGTLSSTGALNIQSTAGALNVASNNGITVKTDDRTGVNDGSVIIKAGQSSTGNGAATSISGGKCTGNTGIGGDLTITGGEAQNGGGVSISTGGHVTLAGGVGGETGGSVVIKGGTGGTTNGDIVIGNDQKIGFRVDPAGAITVHEHASTATNIPSVLQGALVMADVDVQNAGPQLYLHVDEPAREQVLFVSSDGDPNSLNHVRHADGATPTTGMLYIVINRDEQPTTGEIVTPSNQMSICVFHTSWRCKLQV